MSLALDREDPGFVPVEAARVRKTLAAFERQPGRGRAVVAEVGGRVVGYAFLVPFWSNALGGEVCEVDELYVRPDRRDQGVGSALSGAIDAGRFVVVNVPEFRLRGFDGRDPAPAVSMGVVVGSAVRGTWTPVVHGHLRRPRAAAGSPGALPLRAA